METRIAFEEIGLVLQSNFNVQQKSGNVVIGVLIDSKR